jgi:hypothetical protein
VRAFCVRLGNARIAIPKKAERINGRIKVENVDVIV